jgi:UDPglucose 6-dehydrogenase
VDVCIVGAGYVGVVTGACFADCGHRVICVDSNPRLVESVNKGVAPIHELGLNELLARNAGDRLTAQTDLPGAVRASEMVMVCVGTPFKDDQIDLSQIKAVAEQIGAAMRDSKGYKTIVVKSTVVPGTTDGVFKDILEKASGRRAGADFGLGMNPEFLTEGTAVQDFMEPDRIVFGGIDERTCRTLSELYSTWPDVPRIVTNTRTAEMIKYTSNSVLATMISFSNEIGRLCTAIGDIDVVEVMRGVHRAAYFTTRPRAAGPVVAPITSFLEAGCGFGGSCLPKDVSALAAQGAQRGVPMPLLGSVLEINRTQPEELLKLVRAHFPSLEGVRVAVLGLAFKPDTDDVRESPAFPALKALRAAQADIVVYDPVVKSLDRDELRGVPFAGSLAEAVDGADVVVLITRWPEFRHLPEVLASLAKQPLVVDGRRMLDPASIARYEGIGRSVAAG